MTNLVVNLHGLGIPAVSTACGSLNAFDLTTLTSPYTGTTAGRPSSKAVFGISLAPGARLTIGMTSNSFDSKHLTRWGGSCPGTTQVAYTDDPDTLAHTWTNSQSSTQPVYFEIRPYGSGSGTFVLAWSVTGGSAAASVSASRPCMPCAAGKYSLAGSSSCTANVCTCPHGTPTTGNGTTAGTRCQAHNTVDCSVCDAGYHINASVGQQQSCLPNVCTCPHGMPQSGAQCQTHGSVNCSACNAGYGLGPPP
eukprot:COSAG01_NODE_18566_length_1067_cov_1.306818_2_plen_250_part_01